MECRIDLTQRRLRKRDSLREPNILAGLRLTTRALTAKRFSCVLGMLSSLEVQVLRPT